MSAPAAAAGAKPSWFQRFLLPGLALKAVIIGGGYATGRELAEFFMPAGPWGGVAGMVLAMALWSLICVVTFLFARATRSLDYVTFFKNLLGPGWIIYEAAYALFIVLILAVFGAAAGEIGASLFGWPKLIGALVLLVGVSAFTTFGNASVEQLFKWVAFFLYGTYVVFAVLAFTKFGDRILAGFTVPAPSTGWFTGGLTYAGYNIVGAVIILPLIRHLTSTRDAVIAGAVAGPMAMLPALVFFICMVGFYPAIAGETLPSDYILRQMNLPVFHFAFQLMIFAALLESGVGAIHAVNERVATAWRVKRGTELSNRARLIIGLVILVGSIFIADRFGLVTLIAKGYRALAYIFLAVYVAPLLTYGVWLLWRRHAAGKAPAPS